MRIINAHVYPMDAPEIENGYVSGRVDAGITPVDLTSQEQAMRYGVSRTGIYILSVNSIDGFQAGDQILTMDGTAISSMNDYNAVLDAHQVGDTIPVVVRRGLRQVTVNMTLRQAGGTSADGASAA